MRPSLRLAAMMKLPAVFVFTHDSIFVGEDGPTHQPVEQVDVLRAIPGLTVFRPADGVETAMAWAWALQRARGPVALSLTRQGVAALKREVPFALEDVWKGAYRVREPEERVDLVLLASGSEVVLACDAATRLAAEGVSARVVSMPSLELLNEQPEAYRRELVPDDIPVVGVEAGRGESLRGLVGRRGLIHGIDRFGASAPAKQLAEFFGYVPDALTARILEWLR
jgi:transketolase